MATERLVDTALYLRLSREDGDVPQSESIRSQRLLLTDYAARHGLQIRAVYADDGISGTRFDRPAFQEMLRAMEAGRIHTVLVKDLSRLSRDYIRTGELLERWFPEHGVRLIAVCDGVDTAQQLPANDFSPMRAVMDDWYARDISKKVRTAIAARQRSGICTMANLPYGYFRAGMRIIIQPDEATIVREIFAAYRAGESQCQIAQSLTARGIPSPSQRSTAWNDVTIGRILHNNAYRGQLMLRTTEKLGYKSTRKRMRPQSDWMPLPIPAIVSEEEFHQTQAMLHAHQHQTRPAHWLAGRVFCDACGARMTLSAGTRLICGGRKRQNGCENPSMRLDVLEEMLFDVFRADGIPQIQSALPSLVEEVRIGCDTVRLYLRYAKPLVRRSLNAANVLDNGFPPELSHGEEGSEDAHQQCAKHANAERW